MTIKAVIFDMDGVITNSEPIHEKTFDMVMAEYGVKRNKELKAEVVGMPEKIEWDHYKKIFQELNDSTKILYEKREKLFEKYADKVKLFPGFNKLFQDIKQNDLKVALTTSNTSHYIRCQLPNKLKESFDVIVNANQIKVGKPDPEPYTKTINRLKLKPEECVVIEDAINGIISAKAAGTKCIAITNSFPKEKLEKHSPDLIIDSLEEINIEIIIKLGEE